MNVEHNTVNTHKTALLIKIVGVASYGEGWGKGGGRCCLLNVCVPVIQTQRLFNYTDTKALVMQLVIKVRLYVGHLWHSCYFSVGSPSSSVFSGGGNLNVVVDHVSRSRQHFSAIFEPVLLLHKTIQYKLKKFNTKVHLLPSQFIT
jgi:hypothetical protein